MTEQMELNFQGDAEAGGFRLCRFEMLNWGTFDGGVRVIGLNGENGLLTGEIGSGKSTVVDAITTLLIPPSKLLYNKAAGAEAKERTLKSYVEGFYKSERSEEGLAARPVALRGAGSYSVLLGCFHNSSLNADLTLAQVFWSDGAGGAPQRLYAAAERPLSIQDDFSSFGGEIKGLRKKLREAEITVFENYPPYQGYFSRVLGIRSEQALNLFNQTVSMKTIGDLTGFVRTHMLEKFDASERIKNLIRHFDDLTGAHEAVLRAKRQVEMLSPIEKFASAFSAASEEAAALDAAGEALDCWLAGYRSALLEAKLGGFAVNAVRLRERLGELSRSKAERENAKAELMAEINNEGGARIGSLEREIDQKSVEAQRRKGDAAKYDKCAKALSLPSCDTVGHFASNIEKIGIIRDSVEEQRARLQNEQSERAVEKSGLVKRAGEIEEELGSLRARRTNIESRCVAMRERMIEALGIEEAQLPFAGELIEVRREEAKWEGAVERLLHNFGLSLLVPDKYYKQVSDWVEKNNLGGRIVYFRIREKSAGTLSAGADSLLSKLSLKEDSPLYGWLAGELSARFNYVCCDTMDRFRREVRAVTVNGQIKAGELRHEKDDRYKINDRGRYILGWNNGPKIALLERELAAQKKEAARIEAAIEKLRGRERELTERSRLCARISEFTLFSELDWKSSSLDVVRLNAELKELRAASKRLETLKRQLEETCRVIAKIEKERDETLCAENTNGEQRKNAEAQLAGERLLLSPELKARHAPSFPRVEEMRRSLRGESPITLENSQKFRNDLAAETASLRKSAEAEARAFSNKIVKGMADFKKDYILETQDFGADMESLPEYLKLLEQLRRDDLPRFEEKFHKLLHEKTIQEIASFHENLYKSGREIEARIKIINEALLQIDYEPGRFIALEAEREKDLSIRQFQSDLRECTQDSLSVDGGVAGAENRFEAIERIIARFRGRPEYSSEDRRWTEKVTDVRNWYSFAASERWREDGAEYEHYSDSSGKSGGQKEKLAYTILAASLAYQFGLDVNGLKARTFRFVIIDEAFGRGSDESAQFALELFRTLRLQLLIVTPLQKIQVIEPYVSHVAFVSNREGKSSALACLTIEEYRERKEARDGLDD